MSGIYVLENTLNGKLYIGQTSGNIQHRINDHINRHFQVIDKVIDKYGWGNFKQYIYYIPKHLLDLFEIEMIKKANSISPNGYNLFVGGASGMRGHKHTEEAKQKISKALKGKKKPSRTEEHKRNISKSKKNPSEETRKRISDSGKGRIPWNKGKKCKSPSKETKLKLSIAAKKDWNKRKGVL